MHLAFFDLMYVGRYVEANRQAFETFIVNAPERNSGGFPPVLSCECSFFPTNIKLFADVYETCSILH
jgi:hypothetical protein